MAPGGLQRNNTISLKQSVFMVGRRCCAAGYASRAAARPYRLVFMGRAALLRRRICRPRGRAALPSQLYADYHRELVSVSGRVVPFQFVSLVALFPGCSNVVLWSFIPFRRVSFSPVFPLNRCRGAQGHCAPAYGPCGREQTLFQ
jgi:hypothetical protein